MANSLTGQLIPMSTLRQSLKYSFVSSGNARKWRKITPKRRNNTRRFVGRVIADRYKIEEVVEQVIFDQE